MAARQIDRRVRRTKKLLWESLASLILEKGYDQVSVQDILLRADVGRSTFYAHFENKENLLLRGQLHLLESPDGPSKTPEFPLKELLDHAAENGQLARAMFQEGHKHLLLEHMQDFIERGLSQPRELMHEEEWLLTKAKAAGVAHLIYHWINADKRLSRKQVEALIRKIVSPHPRTA